MKYLIPIMILASLLVGCNPEEEDDDDVITARPFFYVVNEGAFGYSNSSISLYYTDDGSMVNNAFYKVNNRSIGDVLQSVTIIGSRAYLMVNASDKIEVVDAKTIEQISTINNVPKPRYMVELTDTTAAISTWSNGGEVLFVNLKTLNITKTVKCGNGAENMLWKNEKLFVCNAGGYSADSTITMIDIADNYSTNQIYLGNNPTDIVDIGLNQIFVLCRGRLIYDANWNVIGESRASIALVNTETGLPLHEYELPAGYHPACLEANPAKTKLYFGGGYDFQGIYEFDIASATVSSTPLINESFYGFNVNPADGSFFCTQAPNFSTSGSLKIYDSAGTLKSTLEAGIGPNGVVFE